MGTAYIASYLKDCKVDIYSQDIYHWNEDHLTNKLNNEYYDIVGFGFIGGYYQYKKAKKIAEAINKSKSRTDFKFIIGGLGPSPESEFFIKQLGADICVKGEGEETIAELINYSKNLDSIKGITYVNENNQIVKNPDREPIKDIDNINWPSWYLFDINHYVLMRDPGFSSTDRVLPMLSGRGCPYKCNFCYRTIEGDFRPRSTENIVEEIKWLQKKYYINGIEFFDELLTSSKKRTMEICESFLKNNLNIKWYCNGRLNIVDEECLTLMKKAGCVFVNYGIECLDNEVLKRMGKNLSVEQIIRGVELTNKVGIIQGLNVIFGNYGDNKDTIRKDVEFLKKYNEGNQFRTIRPVTSYPGSQLYKDAIQQGKIKDCQDFYENKCINSDLLSVNFTELNEDEFHSCLKDANKELINDYYEKNKQITLKQCEDLYDKKEKEFRGFRPV